MRKGPVECVCRNLSYRNRGKTASSWLTPVDTDLIANKCGATEAVPRRSRKYSPATK